MGLREVRSLTLSTLLFATCACGRGVPVVVPTPSPSEQCTAAAVFGPEIAVNYADGELGSFQKSSNDGVATTRLSPELAALEYFASVRLATDKTTRSRSVQNSPNGVTVFVCLNDGSQLRAAMYRPFPSEPHPIWAVQSYASAK